MQQLFIGGYNEDNYFSTEILGMACKIKQFEVLGSDWVVANVLVGNKSIRMLISSITFNNLTEKQKLWLRAWRKWSGE